MIHQKSRLVTAGIALSLAGCQTMQTGEKIVSDGVAALDKTPLCCSDLSEAKRIPLPLLPTDIAVDAKSQARKFDGTKAFFVLLELPVYEKPYALTLTSSAKGVVNDNALFIPRVTVYDAEYTATRTFDEKSLRNRGNDLERTIFINPQNNSERYIAIYGSDLSASIVRPYSEVTYNTVVVGTIMFNVVGGRDGKSTLRSSPTGSLHIEVSGLDKPQKK